MDQTNAFVTFISSNYSLDYWSDVAIEEAIELANNLPPERWSELCNSWQMLSTTAQERMAQIASDVRDSPASIEMLIAMLASSKRDVVEASIDSLNSIAQTSNHRLAGFDVGSAISGISSTNRVTAIVLQSLKNRLNLST